MRKWENGEDLKWNIKLHPKHRRTLATQQILDTNIHTYVETAFLSSILCLTFSNKYNFDEIIDGSIEFTAKCDFRSLNPFITLKLREDPFADIIYRTCKFEVLIVEIVSWFSSSNIRYQYSEYSVKRFSTFQRFIFQVQYVCVSLNFLKLPV